jgi:esterase/lipase
MNITINPIEIACELAENELNEIYSESMIIYEENEDGINYTEKAQEIFDNLYDKHFSFIMNFKTN